MKLEKIKQMKETNMNRLEELGKKEKIFSNLRLFFVLVGVIFFLTAILQEKRYYYFVLGDVIIFLGVGLYFRKTFIEKKNLLFENAVLDEYIYRGNGRWKQFTDNGGKFLKTNKEHDLDIFGRNSLYQFISSARTPLGKEYLANCLKEGSEDIIKSQKVVEELSDLETSIKMNCALKKYQVKAENFAKEDIEALESMTHAKVEIPLKNYLGMGILVACLIVSIVLCFFSINLLSLVIIVLILQFGYTKIMFSKNDIFTYETADISQGLRAYQILFEEFSQLELKEISIREIHDVDVKSLKSLQRICSAIASRKNIFAYLIGNMFFLDYFILLAMKRFKNQKLDLFFQSMNKIAQCEAFLSFANLNIVLEKTCNPVEKEEFSVKNIRHPLLSTDAIGNDFTFKGVVILTGSNMSGKTTFMRSLGLNYVLYRAGSVVVADSFFAPKIELYTSLRVNDLTTEGVSTFYAELTRIKEMMDGLGRGEKIFALVDEIFKGTNALDRLAGAKRVVKNLLEEYAIISTHDFGLCEIKNVKNHHFKEEYIDGKIVFDYKICDGQCETTNGKYLMKLIGLE